MDQKLYQKMFDQIHMPDRRASQVREELAARCSQNEWEVPMDNSKKSRRPMAAVIAVCAVAVLTVTAFASGGRVLERVFKMMTGSTVSQGVDGDGRYYFEDGGEDPVSPVELRDDGRLYLTVNGEDRDITDECSYETPYVYECTGEDGLRHTFIIGGEPDSTGWVEFASDELDDTYVSSMVLGIEDDVDPQTLPWLNKGLEQVTGGGWVIVEPETNEQPESGEPRVYYFEDGTAAGEAHQETVVTLTENQK